MRPFLFLWNTRSVLRFLIRKKLILKLYIYNIFFFVKIFYEIIKKLKKFCYNLNILDYENNWKDFYKFKAKSLLIFYFTNYIEYLDISRKIQISYLLNCWSKVKYYTVIKIRLFYEINTYINVTILMKFVHRWYILLNGLS